jgi:hypothetical protein
MVFLSVAIVPFCGYECGGLPPQDIGGVFEFLFRFDEFIAVEIDRA